MWGLDTIDRINRKAVEQARRGLPERDALFLATGIPVPVLNEGEGEIIQIPVSDCEGDCSECGCGC